MRKSIKSFLILSLAGLVAVSAIGCGGGNSGSGGGNSNSGGGTESKVCNVKSIINGYDTDWLKESIAKFNRIYETEGYEVKLVLEDADIGSVNEVKSYKRNDTDLYFDYNKVNNLVESSRGVLRDDKACLLEDLTDVVDSIAIGENKQPDGEKTIRQKFEKNKVVLNGGKYTGITASATTYSGQYGIPYATGSTGIYLNKKALTTLGYSMDDVLTTDALFDMCDDIVKDYKLDDADLLTRFYPVAYAQSNAGGYPGYMFQYWMAQYMGQKTYENFWKFIPSNGTTVENGYEVYEDYGILETLRVISDLTNIDYCAPGYGSTAHTAAQGRVFIGTSNAKYSHGSLLMVSGDWIFKESDKDYGQYSEDVIAIKVPVISALGMKLGLCGTNHTVKVDGYTSRNEHCDACEAKLRAIIKLVDAYDYTQKTNAQIATEVGVEEADVKTIREARGVIIGETGCYAFIPSYSNAKTVAKLFLKFLFSNDGQKIFTSKTYISSLLDIGETVDTSSMNDRDLSIYEKTNSYNTTTLFPDLTNKLRNVIGNYFPGSGTNLSVFVGLAYSHKNSAPQFTPEAVYKNNIEYVRLSWGDYLSAAGM